MNSSSLLFFLLGLILAAFTITFLAWAYFKKFRPSDASSSDPQLNQLRQQFSEKELRLSAAEERIKSQSEDIERLRNDTEEKLKERLRNTADISELGAKVQAEQHKNTELQIRFLDAQNLASVKSKELQELEKKWVSDIGRLQTSEQTLARQVSVCQAQASLLETRLKNLETEKQSLELELRNRIQRQESLVGDLNQVQAQKESLEEKLNTFKGELEEQKKHMREEFQNLANRILEEKSQKFTELNKTGLESLLKPLGENLESFKRKVEETYDKESKERFSLGEEVKRLMLLNQQLHSDTQGLTRALKGDSKVQGDWGQVILESILEKSGLVKGREFFVQEFLRDNDGSTLKNEEGFKLQPDVILQYPGNRKVIIDSKVSLTAYERAVNAETDEERELAIVEHQRSVRKHIEELSLKNYQDFAKGLDSVMMFMPVEPAYFLAMRSDPELWNYAYQKGVLLLSPTNLIAALKLVADLWRREAQSRNAQEIAERGGGLYDKFVSFVTSLKEIGAGIEKADSSYKKALGQLSEGKGNLLNQVRDLKRLGVKSKKELPSQLVADHFLEQLVDQSEQVLEEDQTLTLEFEKTKDTDKE